MQQLRRDLGLSHAIMTVMGCVIGSGIFALPAVAYAQAQAPGLGIAVWLIGGLISLAAGLTVAELGAAMPRAGGTYEFLSAAYGRWMGFLQGWAWFTVYNSATNAAVAMLITTYLSALIPMSQTAQTILSVALILALTAINTLGVRVGGAITVVTTLGKLVPLALLIIFGLPHASGATFTPMLPQSTGIMTALAGALLPVLFAYDGWTYVGQLAEEIKNPQRNIPLALMIGLSAITVIYTLFNVALAGVLPFNTILGSEKPVVPMASLLFGEGGSKLITVGMLVSMFGTLNAIVMTSPRYYYAMARDGLFPAAKKVASLDPRRGTPVVSLWLSGLWSVVLLLSGKFEQMLGLVVFVGWLFYVLTMIGVIILRYKRPDMHRPYKAWGYPVVPVLAIAAGLWILGQSLISDPKTALIGLGLTATGLPIYLWLRRQPRPEAQAEPAPAVAAD
jgi:basic amino acid/polyamine antiporter, APA family